MSLCYCIISRLTSQRGLRFSVDLKVHQNPSNQISQQETGLNLKNLFVTVSLFIYLFILNIPLVL